MNPSNSRSALLASKATAVIKKRLQGGLLAIALLASWSGAQAGYSNLYVFGDSLSDTGNNAVVFDVVGASQSLPPGTLRTYPPTPSNSFIPSYPYVGSDVYSNGPVWASGFASALGLSAAPSLTGGTNYAYGGARVGPLGNPNPFVDFPNNFPPSLTTQVATFLGGSGGNAPSDALYVVAGGGNDARDIITKAAADIASNLNPTAGILAGAQAYASYVDAMVNSLEGSGAKDIVVWNAPNAGLGPAIIANGASGLGTLVTFLMNQALSAALADDIADATDNVRIFDLFGFSTAVATNPGAFGLVNVTDACSADANIVDCAKNQYNYFFWDGIHPTAAGHRLIAGAMVAFVPEPGTIVLLALGLFGIVATRKRQTI
jgi:outer membrane lipase/esterase